MKKLTVLCIALMLTLGAFSSHAADRTKPLVTSETAALTMENEINVLKVRIEAIKAIDRSTLSSAEKKELRTELRGMKRDLNQKTQASNGVYISTGLIIVILLLIILL